MPKVSVIIPVDTSENNAERCLKSVCLQTLSDIEIICLCDCSANHCSRILQEYAQKDTQKNIWIKCIDFDKKKGAAAAKNEGIAYAHGEYVAFVDCDDGMDVDFYEKLYQKAQETNADCVMGNIIFFGCNETVSKQSDSCSQVEKNRFLFTYAQAAIYKKDFLISHNILFPLQLSCAAKSVFEILIAAHAREIATVSESSYYSSGAVQHDKTADVLNTLKDAVIALKMIIDIADTLDIDIAVYYEALHMRLTSLSQYSHNSNFDEKCKEFVAYAEKKLLDCMKRKQDYLQYENMLQTQQFWNEKLTLKYDRKGIDEKINTALFCGVSEEKRAPRIIVSLTSFPARMYDIHYCLYSLLSQSLKPDEVILWLGEEEFPHKEKDIPHAVLKLQECGLTIQFTRDIKSYKKLIPALKAYPNDVLATADDDIYYPANWLEKLYCAHEQFPEDIICHRAHLIKFNRAGNISPYNTWKKSITASEPSSLYFCTTGAGVLYPPHAFYNDVLDESKFLHLAPFADDIWFWAMAVLNKKKIRIVENPHTELTYVNPQREYRITNEATLAAQNISQGGNNEQLKNILAVYPEILERLKEAGAVLEYFQ